jgi:hypothetical protein
VVPLLFYREQNISGLGLEYFPGEIISGDASATDLAVYRYRIPGYISDLLLSAPKKPNVMKTGLSFY